MDITPALAHNQMVIDGYGAGFFRIRGEKVLGAVLLTPTSLTPVSLPTYAAMTADDFAALIRDLVDVDALLLGQGTRFMGRLAPELNAITRARGLTVDTMDSLAACRTWSVLLSEGRRVAALLWPLSL